MHVRFDVVHAHHSEAAATILGVVDGVVEDDRPTIGERRHVAELRLEAKLVLERVVLMHLMRLQVLAARAVEERQQALIADLELALEDAVVAVRDEVGLPEWGIRLEAELSRLHHRAEEGRRRALLQLAIRRERRQHDGVPA